MITKTLTSAAVLTLSSVALAIGVAAPANAAGNNVVNAHCDDIVLDLKDNPHEADSRGVVAVTVNGRTVYTGEIGTADYHQVLTGFPRHDSGYEWTVTITHPYTDAELFHTYGDVRCQPAVQPEQTTPVEPVETEVPLPEPGQAQTPDEFPTQVVTDVPRPTHTGQVPEETVTTAVTEVPLPTFDPQVPAEYATAIVLDVPFPTFEAQTPLEPTVVTVPVPTSTGSVDVTTPDQPTAPDQPTVPNTPTTDIGTPIHAVVTTGHTPDSGTPAQPTGDSEQPGSPTAAGGIPTDTVLPNLGGPTTGLAVAGAGLLAGGIVLILAARRRTT